MNKTILYIVAGILTISLSLAVWFDAPNLNIGELYMVIILAGIVGIFLFLTIKYGMLEESE